MPRGTFVAKSQKSASGFKVAKDRITFLFCSNASGDRMLKPLLVNKSLKPRALKGQDFKKLPVHLMANKKAWVTSNIFTEWFHKCFVPEVQKYMSAKKLEFNVLLLVDNAPGHPILEHPNVQVVFLPPNTTSIIQPLDQGIISTFKTYYIRRSFQFILNKLESDETMTVIDAWKSFSILDCITNAKLAISELRKSTLNSCWKTIWPECVSATNPTTSQLVEYSDIIALAYKVGGEGFDDMTNEDIDEVFADNFLSDEEILEEQAEDTAKPNQRDDDDDETPPPLSACLIRQGLNMASKLQNHFLTHDPDDTRGEQFERDLKQCMYRYEELYKSLSKKKSQPLITNFFERTTDNIDNIQSSDIDAASVSSEDSQNQKRIRLQSDE